jgi:hypothetical protein
VTVSKGSLGLGVGVAVGVGSGTGAAHEAAINARATTRYARTPWIIVSAMVHLAILAHAAGGLPDHDNLMLLAPLLVILLMASIVAVTWLSNRGVLGDAERTVGIDVSLAAIAAALSFGASAIHLAVIEQHLDEGIAFGAFFLLTGWFQMIWPLAYYLRPVRAVALAGLAVNLGIVGVWVVSRTVGVPFGPTPWVPEAIGFPDLIATVLELGIVGLMLPVALPDKGDEPSRLMSLKDSAILAAFTLAAVSLLTGYALLVPVA